MGFTAAETNIHPVERARLPESSGKKQSGFDYLGEQRGTGMPIQSPRGNTQLYPVCTSDPQRLHDIPAEEVKQIVQPRFPQELDFFSPQQAHEHSCSRVCLLERLRKGPIIIQSQKPQLWRKQPSFSKAVFLAHIVPGERQVERDRCPGPFLGTEMN